jgi:hypothetical protein
MIVFNPPLALPYIPSTQKLAFVAAQWMRHDTASMVRVTLILLDEDQHTISPDGPHMPAAVMTAAQLVELTSSKAALAGDTADQAFYRALLPIVRLNLGVQGGAVQ